VSKGPTSSNVRTQCKQMLPKEIPSILLKIEYLMLKSMSISISAACLYDRSKHSNPPSLQWCKVNGQLGFAH
jgi:hypothetical protein